MLSVLPKIYAILVNNFAIIIAWLSHYSIYSTEVCIFSQNPSYKSFSI